MKKKTCKTCKKTMSVDNFSSTGCYSPKGELYYRGHCKPCHYKNRAIKQGRLEDYNKEKARIDELQHFHQPLKIRRCTKCTTIKPLKEFPTDRTSKCYYGRKVECKECYKVRRKEYVERIDTTLFKDRKRESDRRYYKKHKAKVHKYNNNKYRTDPIHKIKVTLRNSIGKACRSKGTEKVFKTEELLGCTIKEFKRHIEDQFQEGMTWDNHTRDGWHIDHIKPLSSFDLTKAENQLKACHYSNLQPLWAIENMQKGDKLDWTQKALKVKKMSCKSIERLLGD